jgi:F-type H+-transporting ATPase subunit b
MKSPPTDRRVLKPEYRKCNVAMSRWLRVLIILLAVFVVDSQINATYAAGDTKDAAHGEDHPADVPMDWEEQLALFSVITFALFLVVLKKLAWGPIVEGLDNREAKYRTMVEDTEADRDRALALLADYEAKLKAAQTEVDEIIAEARRDAERTKTDILAAAQKEAEVTRDRALSDIDRATDQAVAALFDHVRENVVAATEKVLMRSITGDDQQRLIDEALAEVART